MQQLYKTLNLYNKIFYVNPINGFFLKYGKYIKSHFKDLLSQFVTLLFTFTMCWFETRFGTDYYNSTELSHIGQSIERRRQQSCPGEKTIRIQRNK